MYKIFTKSRILQFSLTELSAYAFSILGCFSTYYAYWHTINTVQTVDFNILSHTLPPKLSSLLIQKSDEELRQTIHSNYGLFGIVVTDCNVDTQYCPNQKILYYSGSTFRKKKPQTNLLANNPYDFLKDPPPLLTESKYPSPSIDKIKKTGKNNPGRIIGRVYYIHGEQPTFLDEYREFITSPLKLGLRATSYLQTTIFFLVLGFLVWLLLVYNQRKFELLKAKVELDRINTLNKTFSHVIESEFSSNISNNLQKLDSTIKGIISRLKTDTNNIIHDIQKAPLLSKIDDFNNFLGLNEQDNNFLDPHLLNLLMEVYESFNTINLVVQELREVTDLEERTMLVQEELQKLKDNLPSTITRRIQVEFESIESPLAIKCNPWRFRSIIRNALYNSSSALKQYSRKIEMVDFNPKISVKCYSENNLAIIAIVDNGPGIPSDILPKLYESQERLNQSAGEFRGNGSLIVSAYLKFHHGKVKKSNNTDGGATVSFLFEISGE
jgi:signal transduction histidine kinase